MAVVCAPLAVANCALVPVCGSIDCTKTGITDRDMYQAGHCIYEGDVGRAGQRPLIDYCARGGIHFHERPIVTSHVKAVALVIDFEPVRAADGHGPMLNFIKVGQSRDKDHRWLAYSEIDVRCRGVCHAPPWLTRQFKSLLFSG